MGQYSAEEIKGFEDKDLRITKCALCKVLIKKLTLEEINDTEKVFELADKYVDYIYGNVNKGIEESGTNTVPEINWEQAAKDVRLPVPNPSNIKILSLILDEYNKISRVRGKPSDLLSQVIKANGKYPTKEVSIKKVLSQLE